MSDNKKIPSSKLQEIVLEEVCEEYSDELTCEQIKELYREIFHEYRELFNDDFNIVRIPRLGTFMPRPAQIENIINDVENNIAFSEGGSEKSEKNKKRLKKLNKEAKRVRKVVENYRKR